MLSRRHGAGRLTPPGAVLVSPRVLDEAAKNLLSHGFDCRARGEDGAIDPRLTHDVVVDAAATDR